MATTGFNLEICNCADGDTMLTFWDSQHGDDIYLELRESGPVEIMADESETPIADLNQFLRGLVDRINKNRAG